MYEHDFSAQISEGFELVKEKPFAVQGRLTRDAFFKSFLTLGLSIVLLGFIPVLGWLVAGAASVSLIMASIRRLHDVGVSGWWFLVPIYNTFLLVQDSDGDNPWGLSEASIREASDTDDILKDAEEELDELMGTTPPEKSTNEKPVDILESLDEDELKDFDKRLEQ